MSGASARQPRVVRLGKGGVIEQQPTALLKTPSGTQEGRRILRFQARHIFIRDPDLTLRELHKRYFDGKISFDSISKWSAEEKWIEERTRFWEAAGRRFLERAMEDAVQRQLQEITGLEEVYTAALERIKVVGRDADGVPIFKDKVLSMDRLLAEIVKLDERLDAKRDHIFDKVGRVETADADELGLTPEESLRLSEALLSARLDQSRAALSAVGEPADASPSPKGTGEDGEEPPGDE